MCHHNLHSSASDNMAQGYRMVILGRSRATGDFNRSPTFLHDKSPEGKKAINSYANYRRWPPQKEWPSLFIVESKLSVDMDDFRSLCDSALIERIHPEIVVLVC